jgi:asparagine synthase (glutamine-hydrolysing)
MRLVSDMFKERYQKSHYLKETLNTTRLEEIISSNSTWFGQLMGAPQLLAWLIQFDFWLESNNINIID